MAEFIKHAKPKAIKVRFISKANYDNYGNIISMPLSVDFTLA
jgi:hypothetical protein